MQAELREEELVRAAQRGDREAFARLYEANAERVYRYVLSRTGESADAEDITSEVFIRAMKALPSYRPTRVPLIAWLFRIAHNESINYIKKRARRGETPIQDTLTASHDPAEAALSHVAYSEVLLAMSGLTDLQREVLSLRFAGELSIAETARAMSRSEQAVKFLQHSALRAMRKVLEHPGGKTHG